MFYNIFVSAYRYIVITTLPIIAIFLEYLRHFLIDFNQIYIFNDNDFIMITIGGLKNLLGHFP